MKTNSIALLTLASLVASNAQAACFRARGPLLIQGSMVSCRSALPDIEEAVEARRAHHEAWAQGLRDRLQNAGSINALRPYDELKAERLAGVNGVIIEFLVESELELTTAGDAPAASPPTWRVLEKAEMRSLYLAGTGSTCDSLPATLEVVKETPECCDIQPPAQDSCIVGAPQVAVPSIELLNALRGDA